MPSKPQSYKKLLHAATNVASVQQVDASFELKADTMLRAWGHNPAHVRELGKLPSGLHWQRVLRKARFWTHELSVLADALPYLLELQAATAPPDGELDDVVKRFQLRIKILSAVRSAAP